MDQSSNAKNIIIGVIALFIAIWLGITIVTEQSETILKIAAAALFLTCIFLGRRIWLLLILFTALNVPLIRGLGTTELGQFLFVGFSVLITMMRRQPYRFSFGEKEVWMLLLAGCILQVYLRNPVGLNIFGAGAVGARPYFMAVMAFFSSLILGNIVVRPSEIRWAFWLSIIGSVVGVPLTAIRSGIGGGSAAAFEQGNSLDDGRGSYRIGSLGVLATIASKVSVSFISPLRAMIHPFWAIIILFSFAAATMSGYRNYVAYVGLVLLVGLAYRSGRIAVIVSSVACALVLAILAFVNLVSPLPPNVQRALSPFPGTWEQRYVDAAEQSTEWRVEMWKEALFTDYWIQNKILGDGLGFTRRELLMMENMSGGGNLDSRSSGMTQQQEAMMVTGGYHSGPVQTVRTVGYVGLIILVLAMIRLAFHAHRQILRCRGTDWFPLALYFGISTIILPPFFVFIVGGFGNASVSVFFSYGIISLLEKNLPLPPYKARSREPFILMANRNRSTVMESQ